MLVPNGGPCNSCLGGYLLTGILGWGGRGIDFVGG